MSKLITEEVSIPEGSLVARSFTPLDYADAYRIRVPGGRTPDVQSLAQALFHSTPGWIRGLMAFRDRAVGVVGLKTMGASSAPDPRTFAFEPGTSLGLFKVFQRSPSEIVMGEDDRHLSFRLSILLQPEQEAWWAVLSTAVQFHGWLGRAYFLPVRPFHRLVVPAMLRSMIRSYSGSLDEGGVP
jgi:uncharacterized protein DUF2867